MTAKDYATAQRMLGKIEGAVCTEGVECNASRVVIMDAIQVIDEVLNRAEEMDRCRKEEP